MARSFASASSQYLSTTTIPSVTYPWSMAVRFYVSSVSAEQCVFSLWNSSTNTHWFRMLADVGGRIRYAVQAGGGPTVMSSLSQKITGLWWSALVIETAANNHRWYFNGQTASTTNNRTPTGIDRLTFGYDGGSAGPDYFDGLICDAAFWEGVALSADDAAQLYAGASPQLVRPDALTNYWPMIGQYDPEIDVVGGLNLTLNNSPTAGDHPRIYWPGWSPEVCIESATVTTFTASAAITIAPITASASATFAAGTKTASAAITITPITASASATFVGTVTASGALVAAPITTSVSATFSAGTKTASAAITSGVVTAAATGTFKPKFTGSVTATTAPVTSAVSATFSPGTKTASATLTTAPVSTALSGTFSPGTKTGSAALTTAPVTASAAAEFVVPSYTGELAVSIGASAASGSATFTGVAYTASGEPSTAAITASAEGTFSPGTKTGSIAASVGAATASGFVWFTPTNDLLTALISYWSMDEASGTRYDSKGSNHLTDNNTVGSATGKRGNAADFELSNSESLTVASNASLQTSDIDWSFACWVNPESNPVIAGIAGKNSGTSSQREWVLQTSMGVPSLAVYYDDGGGPGTGQAYVESTDTLTVGTWNYIVVWHDSVNNEVGIQVNNGTPVTLSHSGGGNKSTTAFAIGQLFSGLFYFDGLIDEALFAKRVWTADERTFLYNNGYGRVFSDLQGGGQSYSASAAITLPGVTAQISGTYAAPTYSGTAALTAPITSASGSATHTRPTYTGAAAVTIAAMTAAAEALFSPGTKTGTGVCTTGVTTAALSAEFFIPGVSGTISATTSPATAFVQASFDDDVFNASAGLFVAAAVMSGTARFAIGGFGALLREPFRDNTLLEQDGVLQPRDNRLVETFRDNAIVERDGVLQPRDNTLKESRRDNVIVEPRRSY